MCFCVYGTPYLLPSFCIKKYLPFFVLIFSCICMCLRVCLCECIYITYIHMLYIIDVCILSVCGTRIQSLTLFSTVQKETSDAPRMLEEGQLYHLLAGSFSNCP